MKMPKKLPRQACLPEISGILPFIAAGLLMFGSVFELSKDGGSVLYFLAGLALLLSKVCGASVSMYRLACLLLTFGCIGAKNRGLLVVAVVLLVASLSLWGNNSLQKGSKYLNRPVLALVAMGVTAILLVDQLVLLIQGFSVLYLGQFIMLAALLVWELSLETRVPENAGPRMQSVPKEGSKLFTVAVMLLMGALTLAFINTLKSFCGASLTDTIHSALDAVAAKNTAIGTDGLLERLWQPMLQYVISMVCCGRMLFSSNIRKTFPAAILVLFFMNNPLSLRILVGADDISIMKEYSWVYMPILLLVLLVLASGLKINKRSEGTSVPNVIAALLAIAMTASLVSGSVKNVKESVEFQKNKIVEAVNETGTNAVYEAAYNDKLNRSTLETAYNAMYKAVKDAAYDSAYKAAQEVGVKDVNITPEDLATHCENIATTIAGYAADYSMQGMEYTIYEDMVAEVAKIPKEIAVQEVLEEVPEERPDLRAETKKKLEKEFDRSFAIYSGKGTVEQMYIAASQAVAPILFESAFDPAYNAVYDGIYELLSNVAMETARETLEEYDGTIYLRAAGTVLNSIPGVVEMIAMVLLFLSLTVQPAVQMRPWFFRLLDWCYHNVGEKLQKCMKLLGGIALVSGALGLLAFILGLLMLPTATEEISLLLIGGGVGAMLLTALYIISTYPLFAFAQVSADVHAIRDRAPVAVLAANGHEEAAVQQSVTATEEPFNPDELPEL